MKTLLLVSSALAFLFVARIQPLAAQQRDSASSPDSSSRPRALDEADSRAAKEAERLVSLPPERIILLLQQEPGLSLEVKKMLVRKAYAQGRVLDPKELSDGSLFRLIREDEETRALITQEILDRGYIRAKPTREELAMAYEEQQCIAAATARAGFEGDGEQRRQGGEQCGQEDQRTLQPWSPSTSEPDLYSQSSQQ